LALDVIHAENVLLIHHIKADSEHLSFLNLKNNTINELNLAFPFEYIANQGKFILGHELAENYLDKAGIVVLEWMDNQIELREHFPSRKFIRFEDTNMVCFNPRLNIFEKNTSIFKATKHTYPAEYKTLNDAILAYSLPIEIQNINEENVLIQLPKSTRSEKKTMELSKNHLKLESVLRVDEYVIVHLPRLILIFR
jgi:hypothetical protein